MICKKCGFENKEDSIFCEFCKSSLEDENNKTVWDKLFIINIITCSVIIGIGLLLLLFLYYLG